MEWPSVLRSIHPHHVGLTSNLLFWSRHLFIYVLFFHWHMVDLHCCVHFCCTTKWFSYTYIHILFSILFHCGLSQDIEYSFLCYTVGPCCLSILHTLWILLPLGVCLCAPQAPHVSFRPPPPPFGNHVYSHVCESASVSQIGSLVS